MKRSDLTPRTEFGVELEDALFEWLNASRRAYEASRDARDEQDEHAAWCRVQSVLTSPGIPTAA